MPLGTVCYCVINQYINGCYMPNIMDREWKAVIRKKGKQQKILQRIRLRQIWNLVERKIRSEATNQMRIATKTYWENKANETLSNPRGFYKAFKQKQINGGHYKQQS